MIKIISHTDNAEKLIEEACRVCYNSYDRMNKNSHEELIKKVIAKGHLSVLEHASITFMIVGSRAMTHELVRHRLASFSQESQRYVRYSDVEDKKKNKEFGWVVPPTIAIKGIEEETQDDDARSVLTLYQDAIKRAEVIYRQLLERGIPAEDARYVLPNATTTTIYMTVNLRELRHIFEVRCNPRAHWEIRENFVTLLRRCKSLFPNVFYDFVLEEHSAYLDEKIQKDFLKTLKAKEN